MRKKIERLVESIDGDIAEPIKNILRKFHKEFILREEAESLIMRLVSRKIDVYLNTLEASKEK